jgi:hypothetical protein
VRAKNGQVIWSIPLLLRQTDFLSGLALYMRGQLSKEMHALKQRTTLLACRNVAENNVLMLPVVSYYTLLSPATPTSCQPNTPASGNTLLQCETDMQRLPW